MTTIERIVLGVLFLVLVAALIKWKRPALWAKMTKPFKRKS